MSKIGNYCQVCYDNLSCLESIIKMTKDVCLEHESSSVYYDLKAKDKFRLSEERNHYINMMTMALDRVSVLKNLNDDIEGENYNILLQKNSDNRG